MKKIRINLLGIIGAKKTFMGDGVYVKEDCLCIPLDNSTLEKKEYMWTLSHSREKMKSHT